jgi:hypothetical protein
MKHEDENLSDRWPFEPRSLTAATPLRLLVTWRPSKSDPGVGEIVAGEEVQRFLREACEETLFRIRERRPRDYEADMVLEEDECIVLHDDELVLESAIGKAIFKEAPLPVAGSRDLPPGALTAYAVVDGEGADQRAFVRKANPRKSAGSGKLTGTLESAVELLEAPVFSFDDHFDLVITGEGAIALDQKVFETVFKPLADEAVEGWVHHLVDCLPLAGNGARLLADRCTRSAVLRRKLKTLVLSGHLPRLTPDDVRAQLQALKLPEREFIDGDGNLVFDRSRPGALLDLLNEDLTVGPFSGSLFRIDRKTADIQD